MCCVKNTHAAAASPLECAYQFSLPINGLSDRVYRIVGGDVFAATLAHPPAISGKPILGGKFHTETCFGIFCPSDRQRLPSRFWRRALASSTPSAKSAVLRLRYFKMMT
jgi:hypothetical protein